MGNSPSLWSALILVQWPLGTHIARIMTDTSDMRAERAVYRLVGVNPSSRQPWSAYAVSVLAFSLVGALLLYALLRAQALVPFSLGMPAVPSDGAFNTAASFVTNTNWQWHSGESTLGYPPPSTAGVLRSALPRSRPACPVPVPRSPEPD